MTTATPAPPRRRTLRPALRLAVTGLALALALILFRAPAALELVRQQIFDSVLLNLRPAPSVSRPVPAVIVVDIGDLDENGLPWDRASTARLAAAIAASGPAVMAFDIVFSGDCTGGTVNEALARAIAAVPTVLGFLLADVAGLPPQPPADMGMAGRVALWQGAGAEAACPILSRGAVAAAAMALPGDADGVVRHAPAGFFVGGMLYPALAVETARRGLGAAAPVVTDAPALHLEAHRTLLDRAGQMRLAPTGPTDWAKRTLSAVEVLAGQGADRLHGSVVLVGSSLPRRGGLRATAASPVQPSVQIHADLASALMAGAMPQRPLWAPAVEAAWVVLSGLVMLAIGARGMIGLWVGAGMAALSAAAALLALRHVGLLFDPVLPGLCGLAIALLAVLGQAAATARAERALRARMGQIMPAAVVARLADFPGLLRLDGELRQVTALFTDIEGFSTTSRSLGPQALVRMLDDYFTLATAIALRHGGMVDKIVGDGMLVLFNAPLDQPGHADAALTCAVEIIAATDTFRAVAGIGRTRIGLETGEVVLGDVGSGGKIDYTAHGDAVNLASRLQDMNKLLGTSICIGPGAAAQITRPLRPLGAVEIRSFGMVEVHTLAT